MPTPSGLCIRELTHDTEDEGGTSNSMSIFTAGLWCGGPSSARPMRECNSFIPQRTSTTTDSASFLFRSFLRPQSSHNKELITNHYNSNSIQITATQRSEIPKSETSGNSVWCRSPCSIWTYKGRKDIPRLCCVNAPVHYSPDNY